MSIIKFGDIMFKEFWNDIVLLNLNSFENIGFDFYINVFIFFVAVAFCLFAFYIESTRGLIHLLISQMKRHNSYSLDDSKTLSELGLKSNLRIKRLIAKNHMLSRVIARSNVKNYTFDEYVEMKPSERRSAEKIDFDTEKFYIQESATARASDIYSSYGFSLGRLMVFCLLILIIFTSIMIMSPEILRSIDNAIGEKNSTSGNFK